MVKKFINIDETVDRVMEVAARAPDGMNDETREIIEPQLRCNRVAGEFARFYMDEANLGTDPNLVLNAMVITAAQALFQTISKTEECEAPVYPDDPVHSMVHQVVGAMSAALHLCLAQQRGIDIEGITETVDVVKFDTKEVGDA